MKRKSAGWALVLWVTVACAQTATQTPIKQGGTLIGPGDLPDTLAQLLQVMGGRMTTPATAQVLISGSTKDSSGTRAAQITVQSPGYFSYREGTSRAITFDGVSLQTLSGAPTAADEAILESLLAWFPDTMFLQAANGGGLRTVGTHVRTDDGTTKNYQGPYWTLFAFSPAVRKGFTWQQPLQQDLFIAVDEKTHLIAEVRRTVKTGPHSAQVTQTQFLNWSQSGGQWFPAEIVRLESGVQSLSFTVQTATAAPAAAAAVFKP